MNTRPSPIAGTWYPGSPRQLTRQLSEYLAAADAQPPPGRLVGLVVPHAGYRYSGSVAAYGFKVLSDLRPELVAVISPMHNSHRAPLFTSGHDAYQTPLGPLTVAAEVVADLDRSLRHRLGFGLTPVYNDSEHAIEIELPFLQHILGPFQLLPVMMAAQQADVAQALGAALADVLRDRQALLVASSDLSHFYPHDRACQLDAEIIRRLEAFDPQGILDANQQGSGFACGRGAIAAVLWAARQLGTNRVTVLHHATSGDVSGDLRSVVGYLSAAIWQQTSEGE